MHLGPLRQPARALAFAALTAGSLALLRAREALSPTQPKPTVLARHKRRYFGAMLRLFGADLEVLHGPPPPSTRGRLIVSNHRSALDIGVLMWLFDAQVLSRGDLADWPLVGHAARRVGTLFVDRGDLGSRAVALRSMRRVLEGGGSLIVFAEGTTFGGDEVRPFHLGAFAATRGLDVEVLPVGLAYEPGGEDLTADFGAHLRDLAARPTTRVVVSVGEPMSPQRDPRKTAEQVREAVARLVIEARAAV